MALVIGNAISIPIFVLPGPLAGDAGPSVLLATLFAAVPSMLLVVYSAQLASAMPVAGGLYVYISRLTAPYWGFLVPFTLPLVAWAGLLFTAIGFAEYTRFFIDIPAIYLVYVFLVFVLLINLLGIRIVATVQIFLVFALFLSLLTFIVPGLFEVNPANYTPFFPEGYSPFVVAVVAMIFPFLGFGLLTEIGEEIDDPGKIIPLSMFAGVVVVTVIYISLMLVLVGVVPWQELGDMDAAVAQASVEFLPSWAAGFVALGALFAVATSVNMTLLVSSRTIMRAARDGVLPQVLARIHPRFNSPYISIMVLGVPPMILAYFIRREVVELAVFMGLVLFTAFYFSSIALWNLPREFPEHYENASFRLKRRRGLFLSVIGGSLLAGFLWMGTLATMPISGFLLLGWFSLGYIVYRYQVRRRGDGRRDLFMKMVTLEEHEERFAETQSYGESDSDET